ncbi:Pseudouridine-metabolizing bifunctional protein [Echinococcus granulosus]|uniref:Pseudouridine-metabolizing bifunctional protein n=1 Tax=Echinococcus granulosus TaxID=6210 RepID=W6V6U3_ECHGR|nr:Pseudouridine-metabolizing bifunctional protein [Echinococcus granulosus]EUB62139.1 Pseudouridine-metabolizing bifunctional protein [Echinococcus granulosus]
MIGLGRLSTSLARGLTAAYRCQHHLALKLSTAASPFVCVSEEVQEALANRRGVVALESTILTHGLPADRAHRLGVDVEAAVRTHGAVPATVAIFDGCLHVGLARSDLDRLIDAASQGNARKAAIRDLPFALTCSDPSRVFGTTVSSTSFAAHFAGIHVFATGGTGGVHLGAEVSMDVSSDLLTLESIPIAVVSAGVKSILDIPKTLEVLESRGVTVASVGTDIFPAFFTRNSGVTSPGRVDSPEEAARLFATSLAIRPSSGMLLAVPIPEHMQAVGETVARAIEKAHKEAEQANITGSNVTPFMLERVRQLTDDASLEANIRLVLNNAKFAAQTAVNLAVHMNALSGRNAPVGNPEIVVVGGSNVDMTVKLRPEKLKTTKDIYPPASYLGTVEVLGGGGVGRNVADAVGRLSSSHIFLTAVSNDADGQSLLYSRPFISWKTAPILEFSPHTAKYIGVLNSTGELLFGVADMDIHKLVTPAFVESELKKLALSHIKVICADGNVDTNTLKVLINIAKFHKVPFWYEPTDLHKCTKIIDAITRNQPIDAISPNLTELKGIYLKVTNKQLQINPSSHQSLVECAGMIRRDLIPLAANWFVKMGKDGVVLVNQAEAYHFTSPVVNQASIASVSGAGDTSVGVILYLRYMKKWSWKRAVLGGLKAAELSLACKNPVPDALKPELFDNEGNLNFWAKKIQVNAL